MAHMIDFSQGLPAYVFAADEGPGWHGLGQAIDPAIANDPRKIAEACGAAYLVEKLPVYVQYPDGTRSVIPNREAVTRMDTLEVLEVMSGNKFHVPQPHEYFETFRDALAKNHLHISSAGVLKGGRIVFVCAKLHDAAFSVLGMDPVDSYICIGGGYNGDLAHFGMLSSMRSVCWNTLSANLATTEAGGKLWRMSHAAAYDGAALARALGLAGKELATRAEVFNKLAETPLNDVQAAEYFASLADVNLAEVNATDENGKPKVSAKLLNKLNALADAYRNGPGATLATAQGTAWGALNAVTYFADHLASTRDSYSDGTGASRFASAKFGDGNAFKNRALEMLLKVAA